MTATHFIIFAALLVVFTIAARLICEAVAKLAATRRQRRSLCTPCAEPMDSLPGFHRCPSCGTMRPVGAALDPMHE